MKKLMLSMAAVPLLVGGLSVTASAADGINVLNDVKVSGQIRPRYEYADVKDNGLDAGQALTSRVKLNASANLFGVEGLNANVGLIGVYDFGWSSENGFNQGKTEWSANPDGSYEKIVLGPDNDKIVDPATAMLSNLEMTYKVNKTLLHVGRGQVNLDNQRFIGTVGWRQLERSYDSAFIADSTIPNLNILAAYVWGLEGVASNAQTNTATVLLHANYKVMDELSITAYDYMIANFADIYGAALTGKINAGPAKLSYRAEYAMEADNTMEYGSNSVTNSVDADYYNIDVSANISGVIVGVDYEFMSGADGDKTTFISPLGTNHKFNGWADVYLGGHAGTGLIDMNGKIGYTAKGFGKVLAVYHQFLADTEVDGQDDMGSEIDFLYANKISAVNGLSVLLKGALFSGGDIGQTKDVEKYWVQLDYKFSTK